MDDSLNICLACGSCCDGTLIGFVELDPEEMPAIKKIMAIEEEKGNGFFLQPCKKYCDGCTVYSQRPKHCAKFECGLLKSVEKKEVEFDAAVEIVKVVRQKRKDIEVKLAQQNYTLQSDSFYFKMVELEKQLQNKKVDLSITKIQQELLLDLQQLENILAKNFGLTLF